MTNPRSVYLLAASARTVLGDFDQTWQALLDGQSGIAKIERFDTSAIDYHLAACVAAPDFERKGSLLRGLIESCIDTLECRHADAPVFWAGVKSDVEFIEAAAENIKDDAMLCCAPHFRRMVATQLGLSGRGLDINAACASSTVAMALAADRIAHGEESAVVIAAADIVSRFSFMGFSALKALSPTICRPFDTERDGLCLGDGAVIVVLADEATAQASGFTPLGRLTGWGIANDANHITGPARDGRGLVAAIEQALQHAESKPDDIAAFMAHGTGTSFNDSMEQVAIDTVFGERRFPVASIKGAVGHTLGAAGALEAAFALKARAANTMPPTAGFRQGEACATGRVSSKKQKIADGPVLSTNSGFGGVNVALVLEEVRS